MILGLILLILGVVIIGFAGELVDTTQKTICEADASSNQDIANKYNEAVQQYVCSEICPCPAGNDSATQKLWSTYDEASFNEWGRTKKTENQGENKGLYWVLPTETDKKSYATWRECYDGVLKAQQE